MYFLIYDASGKLRHKGDNWPLARSALDFLIAMGVECPRIEIRPEKEKKGRS